MGTALRLVVRLEDCVATLTLPCSDNALTSAFVPAPLPSTIIAPPLAIASLALVNALVNVAFTLPRLNTASQSMPSWSERRLSTL